MRRKAGLAMRKVYIYCTSDFTADKTRYTTINAKEAVHIVDNDLVIIIDAENKLDSYKLFKMIYQISNNGNRVFIIGSGLDEEYTKNIFCLAVAKSIYNVYTVDSLDLIDTEYIERILKKENTIQDIENYIGSDIVFSETIGNLILEIISKCNENDDEGLIHYIKINLDILRNSVYYNERMRSVVDKLTSEVATLKKDKEEMVDEYEKMKHDSVEKDSTISNMKAEMQNYRRDLQKSKSETEAMVARLNAKRPTISSFQQVYTGTMAQKRTKSILYFKEVTYVRYANSLILSILNMLSKNHQLNVRLVIYDNKNDFSTLYKPLNIVTQSDYRSNEDRLLVSNAMVVVEPSQVIIESLLKKPHDVLIIYDRMKLAKDIVHGNDVFKYWIINSKANYEAIKSEIADTKYVITRPGVLNECLAIPEIKDYNNITESAKLAKYRALENACQKPEGRIVDNILARVGIELPKRG